MIATMASSRECIHLSLGSTANAVTAHMLNLEGATLGNCDPNVTHAVHQQCYTPRVLVVDEPYRFRRRSVLTNASVDTWDGETIEFKPRSEEKEKEWLQRLHETAQSLVQSQYSRYHVERRKQQSYATNQDGRHVVWENDDEEEEEETEEEKLQRQEREKTRWIWQTKRLLEEEMESQWREHVHDPSLSWIDFWMPPQPPYHKYGAPLDFAHNSVVETWDTYRMGSSDAQREWKEEVLFEKLRHILEDCDWVQGVTVVTEGHGVYAGLATQLLQEMQQECRTAARLALHVTDPEDSSSAQPTRRARVERKVEQGLTLHGLATQASLVLPLSVSRSQGQGVFEKTSQLALAIETATFFPRVAGIGSNKKHKIGLTGYYGGEATRAGYGTTAKLSFGEFLANLQPSPRFKILELSCGTFEEPSIPSWLMDGTSIERREMMQHGKSPAHRRRGDVLPGGWLDKGGVLQTLSPNHSDDAPRSLHYNFALSSGLRLPTTGITDLLTCLMEGMGIRFRPQVTTGLVLNESISSLVDGSYWKTLLPSPGVISVLSNSTTSYPYLDEIAANMEECLSRKYRGYFNQLIEILPESEDCLEARDYCLDVRDIYHPPNGLVSDEDKIEDF